MVWKRAFFSDRPAGPDSRDVDPLSEVVSLLRPRAAPAGFITGNGNWSIRHADRGSSGFCLALEGRCLLEADGCIPQVLYAQDFVLLTSPSAFALSGSTPDMRALGGHFRFEGVNPGLLASLVPRVIHLRGSGRLAQLMDLVDAESRDQLPGCDAMLARLAELMLVEAMRQTTVQAARPGLLRGLGDARIAPALVALHSHFQESRTVEQLAKAAGLSRSAFHDRFTDKVGMAPMEYLQYWRIEIAKDLLRREGMSVPEVAARVGYRSGSAFSVAFSKQVGQSPARYARGGPTVR